MEKNTQEKAAIAELKVALRACEKGFVVSQPMTEGQTYDFIFDDGVRLYKAQVKYTGKPCSRSKESFPVYLSRIHTNGKGHTRKKYKKGDFDLLLAYLPTEDKIVCFEAKDVIGKTVVIIRTKHPKNNQKKNIKLMEDYLW